MSSDEVSELQEAAEHARKNRRMAPVSLTMAVLAVLVATVGVLGHRAHTEEVLTQNKATDQWSYYQAKNMRRSNYEALLEFMDAIPNLKLAEAAKAREHFQSVIERYGEEQKEIEKEARGLEAEVNLASRRAGRFDLGEVFLEIAQVITSITLLTERRSFWYFGIVVALLGVAVAATGYVVR
jgi:hypothetical protein